MALSGAQLKKLQATCNTMNLNMLLGLFKNGQVSLADLPGLNADRRAKIEQELANMPDPRETRDWEAIEKETNEDIKYTLLEAYVAKWGASPAATDHLSTARTTIASINVKRNLAASAAEKDAWDDLENNHAFDDKAIREYLKRYPNTCHKDEIEEMLWGLTDANSERAVREYMIEFPNSPKLADAVEAVWTLIDKDDVLALDGFIKEFPHSPRVAEAKEMMKALVAWAGVRESGDIFSVAKYVRENPKSPYHQDAQILLMKLQRKEIENMKDNLDSYSEERMMDMLYLKILSEHNLITEGIITSAILDQINQEKLNIQRGNPNPKEFASDKIKSALESARPSSPEGYTDVFLFGIPGTGKTCVLMGLAGCNQLSIDFTSDGGDYAEALQDYIDIGATPPSNPGDYVVNITGTISEGEDTHHLNFIEMSGEEFAFKIAKAEKEVRKVTDSGETTSKEKVLKFEDMGTGATNLLSSANRKAFFIIIDPTREKIYFKRRVITHYNEETGQPVVAMKTFDVKQSNVISRMVSLFSNPQNAEIMKRVDSIHIILTKSDMLGDESVRETEAMEIIRKKYEGILKPLYRIAKEYNINVNTGYRTKLYTFSLGNFYLGGRYEYESKDSEKLVAAICNATDALRPRSFFSRFCDWFE